MRILQLNVWTGRIKGALLDFLRNNDFDAIRIQEAVWSNGKQKELENFLQRLTKLKKLAD